MSEWKDLDGAAKNWALIKQDWEDVRAGWSALKAEQKGWTHQYMQNMRTLTRFGPILSAHLIGIGGPALVALLILALIF